MAEWYSLKFREGRIGHDVPHRKPFVSVFIVLTLDQPPSPDPLRPPDKDTPTIPHPPRPQLPPVLRVDFDIRWYARALALTAKGPTVTPADSYRQTFALVFHSCICVHNSAAHQNDSYRLLPTFTLPSGSILGACSRPRTSSAASQPNPPPRPPVASSGRTKVRPPHISKPRSQFVSRWRWVPCRGEIPRDPIAPPFLSPIDTLMGFVLSSCDYQHHRQRMKAIIEFSVASIKR